MMIRIVGIVVAAAVLVAGLVAWFRGRPSPPSGADLAVIGQLKSAGSDVSNPHQIEFFLYFPNLKVAEQAATSVRQEGFAATVEPGADSSSWLCLATKSVVPTPEAMAGIRASFEELATKMGGKYDGWGAPIVQ